MKLMDGFDSNYRYILVAARRARQLQGGAPPVIETPSRKPCRIAQDEIKAGKVKWVIPEIPRSPAEVAGEMLEKAHVAATPGVDFDPVHGRQFIRFSYARSAQEMNEAVERIARWLK